MRFAFHKFQDTQYCQNNFFIIRSQIPNHFGRNKKLHGDFFRKFLGQINNSLSIQKLHGIVGFKVGNPYFKQNDAN
jgi:hypothetical protein